MWNKASFYGSGCRKNPERKMTNKICDGECSQMELIEVVTTMLEFT
jgi:hypothetical protein